MQEANQLLTQKRTAVAGLNADQQQVQTTQQIFADVFKVLYEKNGGRDQFVAEGTVQWQQFQDWLNYIDTVRYSFSSQQFKRILANKAFYYLANNSQMVETRKTELKDKILKKMMTTARQIEGITSRRVFEYKDKYYYQEEANQLLRLIQKNAIKKFLPTEQARIAEFINHNKQLMIEKKKQKILNDTPNKKLLRKQRQAEKKLLLDDNVLKRKKKMYNYSEAGIAKTTANVDEEERTQLRTKLDNVTKENYEAKLQQKRQAKTQKYTANQTKIAQQQQPQ